MKGIGNVFRWFLSINSVWGLMIITAFALTVWQHYQPKTSRIDPSLLQEGENDITVTLTDKGGEKHVAGFKLNLENGAFVIPDPLKDRKMEKGAKEKTYLVSSSRRNGKTLLTWDMMDGKSRPMAGAFVISVNGKSGAKGNLVSLQSLTDSALDYAEKAFKIGLGLVSTFVLFLGLMKVGEDAGLVQMAARVLRPAIRLLFPEVPPDHPANGAIIMNITTGFLGLGNAATPFGLKAMAELQSLNPHKGIATNSMVMMLAWNTAGVAIIPTSMLAIRKSAGCTDPFEIIGPCLISASIATITAVIMVKLLGRLRIFSVESALAEELADGQETGSDSAPADEEKKGA